MTKFKHSEIDKHDRHRPLTKKRVSLLHSPFINDYSQNVFTSKCVLLECEISISRLNHHEDVESSHCITRSLIESPTEFSNLESSIAETFNKFVNDNEINKLGRKGTLEYCQPELKWRSENCAPEKKRKPMMCVEELNRITGINESELIQEKNNLKYYFDEICRDEGKQRRGDTFIHDEDDFTSFAPTLPLEFVQNSPVVKFSEPVKDNLSLPTVSIGKTYKSGTGMETIEIFDYAHQKVDVSKIQIVYPTSPFGSCKESPTRENRDFEPSVVTFPISDQIAPMVLDTHLQEKLPGKIKPIQKEAFAKDTQDKSKASSSLNTKKSSKPSGTSNGIWKLVPLDAPIRICFTRQNIDLERCHLFDPRILYLRV